MTKTPPASSGELATPSGAGFSHPQRAAGSTSTPRLAGLVAVEPATRNLLALWLGEHHWAVADLDADPSLGSRAPQVLVVEVPFPRVEAPPELPALARRFPGVPIVVVSPTIVAGTPVRGDVARQLGVAAVLAMPLSCATLLATVDELTGAGR